MVLFILSESILTPPKLVVVAVANDIVLAFSPLYEVPELNNNPVPTDKGFLTLFADPTVNAL